MKRNERSSARVGTAVLFICRRSSAYVRQLARLTHALRPELSIVIVSDRPEGLAEAPVREIFVPDAECLDAGYQGSNYLAQKPITAWDRALFHAVAARYERCWIIEDDVLFRDPAALVALIERYGGDPSDVVCGEYADKVEAPKWHHWHTTVEFFPDVVAAHAFVPLCRLSRRMLEDVAEIAAAHGKLCFVESMVGSLAKALHMQVAVIGADVATLRYRPPFTREQAEQSFARGLLAVHPCKEIVET